MKREYFTKEDLKKIFDSPLWQILHEGNVEKYFPKKN